MASSLPEADGTRAGGRRSPRPAAVIAAALAALLLLAALADGRLLLADPDASAVTDADRRLAGELFGSVTPPASLAEACFADDGTIDPDCLGDGRVGPAADEVDIEVVPRPCREDRTVDAGCIERELDVDVPARCTRSDGGVDVGCLVEEDGTLLVLTDQCIEDDRIRPACLTIGLYGVPDVDAEERTYESLPTPVPGDEDEVPAPDRTQTSAPDTETDDEEQPEDDSGLEDLIDAAGTLVGYLLLAVLAVALVALVVWALRGWRWRREPAAVPEVDDEEHDRAVMAASVEAGARRLDLSGDPRQAIIAAYALMLEGLAACAQGRHPAKTPLEHLERVLAALDVRPEPLRDLTALFGEARFSDHAMTDAQRDQARAALAAAAVDLERERTRTEEPVG